jgi:integrase
VSTIKAVLRKKPNKEGLYPIVVRITKNRKSSFVYTGQYIELKYWDEKNFRVKRSHPNSNRLNNFIAKRLSEINDTLLETVSEDKKASIQNIKGKIKKEEEHIDFFKVAELHLSNLDNRKQIAQAKNEKGRLKVFSDFLKKTSIEIEDVTPTLLKKFQAHLLVKKELSERTVSNYLILIRTIYNLAINEGYVDRKFYPFGKGKIQIKIPESLKIGLNKIEVKKLELIEDLTDSERYTLDVWLLSFYFAGIRVRDVLELKWEDFIDGRLHYRMSKNSKLVTLKIPNKAQSILEKYKPFSKENKGYVFPEMKKANLRSIEDIERKVKTATRTYNKHLKRIAKKAGINKPISFHTSRHSFATISGQTINIHTLRKLYRHSSISTTIQYMSSFVHDDFDEALDTVIDF